MPINEKESIKIKCLRYTGPKPQKQVSWLTGRPVFNEVNNFTVELPIQQVAKAVATCPSIFQAVDSVDAPWDTKKPKAKTDVKPTVEIPKQKPVTTLMRRKGGTKDLPKPESRSPRLFGKAGGTPFNSEVVAKSQIHRIAKTNGIAPEQLEVQKLSDGYWITIKVNKKTEKKVKESARTAKEVDEVETGETEAELEEGLEFTDAQEG